MTNKPYFFFSYTHTYASEVHPIVDKFIEESKEDDIEYFFDRDKTEMGDKLDRKIEEGIRKCTHFIYFVGTSIGKSQEEEVDVFSEMIGTSSENSPKRIRILVDNLRVHPRNIPIFRFGTTIFYPLAVHGIDKIVEELKRSYKLTEPTPKPDSDLKLPNPYKGLRSFDVEDAQWFFGRTDEIEDVLKNKIRVTEYPNDTKNFLAIAGASGTGKSSFVKAGLVSSIISKQWSGIPNANWNYVIVHPGKRPLSSLGAELAKKNLLDVGLEHWLETALKSERNESLMNVFNRQDDYWIIYFDQFEEVITLCKASSELPDEKEEELEIQRGKLLANIVKAIECKRLIVLLSLRDEFVCAFCDYNNFKTLLEARTYQLPTLNYNSQRSREVDYKEGFKKKFREIIAAPAVMLKRPHEEAFINRMIESALKIEGVLPMIQLAMNILWTESLKRRDKAITANLFDEISNNGLKGIIEKHAQQVFEEMTKPISPKESEEELKFIFRKLFLPLIQIVGEGEALRRVALKDEILSMFDSQESPIAERMLNELSNQGSRLLTIKMDNDGRTVVEVTHEVLFREWPELKTWVEARRKDLRRRTHYEELAKIPVSSRPLSLHELKEALKWKKQNPDLVTRDVQKWLMECQTYFLRRKFSTSVGAICLLVIIALSWSPATNHYKWLRDYGALKESHKWQGKKQSDIRYIEVNKDAWTTNFDLSFLPNAEYLTLSGIEDLSLDKLKGFENLKYLEIENCTIDSVSLNTLFKGGKNNKTEVLKLIFTNSKSKKWTFGEWPHLEALDISIQDLTGIQFSNDLPNLISIRIRSNINLNSVLGWQHLKRLKELTIVNNEKLEKLNLHDGLQGIKELRITSNGKLKTIEGWEFLSSLENLTIGFNSELINLKFQDGLQGLKELNIWGNSSLTTIEGLEFLSSLENLNIGSNSELINLKFQDGLQGLKELNIWGKSSLTTIEGLKYLSSLEKLSIRSKSLREILNFHEVLQGLKELTISGDSSLKTIEGLHCLSGLKELNIKSNSVLESLNFQDGLQGLKKLNISNNRILKTIEGWEYLKELEELTIMNNDSLENLTFYDELQGLKKLNTSNISSLNNIDDWEGLIGLEELTIENNNKLENLKFSKGLQGLKKLNIWRNNKLNNIEGWEYLTSLEELSIENNNTLECLKFPEGQQGLKILKIIGNKKLVTSDNEDYYLTNNFFKAIQGLEHLTELEKLNIQFTSEIENLQFTSKHKGLKELTLWHNEELETIQGMEYLSGLEKLSVGYNNKLGSIKFSETIKGLRKLNIQGKIEFENTDWNMLNLNYIELYGINFSDITEQLVKNSQQDSLHVVYYHTPVRCAPGHSVRYLRISCNESNQDNKKGTLVELNTTRMKSISALKIDGHAHIDFAQINELKSLQELNLTDFEGDFRQLYKLNDRNDTLHVIVPADAEFSLNKMKNKKGIVIQ